MKKYPKLSYAILKGIEKYPNEAHNIWITAERDSACAIGGALGFYNIYPSKNPWLKAISLFNEEYGVDIFSANDGLDPDNICNESISRDVIAGMLKAIGE